MALVRVNGHRESGEGFVDDMSHRYSLVRENVCVFALQETDNWKVSAMNVPGYV